MKAKKFTAIILALICAGTVLIFSGCAKKENPKENPKVQVEMENGGTFVIELYPEYAPKTVDNFVKLVKEGFYDGLVFHRIVDGFMAQGGGQDANGTKKQADTIPGEFKANGYTKNTLEHTKGVISMARADTTQFGDPKPGYNSASSEFFIMYDYPYSAQDLDGKYAAFGKVIEGMDVVDKFQEVERVVGFDGAVSQPVVPLVIKKMTLLE